MSSEEFLCSTPAYAIVAAGTPALGDIKQGQLLNTHSRKLGGKMMPLLFTDRDLAEAYLGSRAERDQLQLFELETDDDLEWFIRSCLPSDANIAVDLNHKTGMAQTFPVGAVLKRWADE